jgi:hypothetical protein
LVTDNFGLTIAAREVDERHRWPLAMLDSDVAALLWVRSPAVAEDLPRQQLLATVYAGMQPGSHLWMRYVEEIERLEQSGSVSEDQAIVLRSRTAREALMDVTLGETDNVDADSIGIVVERVRGSLQGPLLDDLEAAQAEIEGLRRSVQESSGAVAAGALEAERMRRESTEAVAALRERVQGLERAQEEQFSRLRQRAEARAGTYVVGGLWAVAVFLIAPAALSRLMPDVEDGLPSVLRVGAAAGGGLIFLLTLLVLLFGGSARGLLRPAERRLAGAIERRWRRNAGLPARASSIQE